MRNFLFLSLLVGIIMSCQKNDELELSVNNPNNAQKVSIDRFSDNAAVLMRRSLIPELPAENAPINFDEGMFTTQSFGPNGQVVNYYNFDVQPNLSAPLYVLVDEQGNSIPDQLNIIDVIPGDAGYSDFWQVVFVRAPENYKANSISSSKQIFDLNLNLEPTTMVVNCPVVPFGSTAIHRYDGASNDLHQGWYNNQAVFYFTFEEKALELTSSGLVPASPIYVTFNINPDENNPESGPMSGFVSETGTLQTHNVIATIPSQAIYSPLWSVNVYDNADFEKVLDLNTAQTANILAPNAMLVNCPVYFVAN